MDYVRLSLSLLTLFVAVFSYLVTKRTMAAAREIEEKSGHVTSLCSRYQAMLESAHRLLVQQLADSIQRQDTILLKMDNSLTKMVAIAKEMKDKSVALDQRANELGV